MPVKKQQRIEFRYDEQMGGNLDEVCIRRPDFVHFERMSDGDVWCGITVGAQTVHVRIGAKNGKSHVYYTAELDPHPKTVEKANKTGYKIIPK